VRIASRRFRAIDSQHDSIEHPAAAFGARGTPDVMKVHEIMGIEANRSWGVCSLNEFRQVCLSLSLFRARRLTSTFL
jgi:hypothetical protein